MCLDTLLRIIPARLAFRLIVLAVALLVGVWPGRVVPDEKEAALKAQGVGSHSSSERLIGTICSPVSEPAVGPSTSMALRRKQFQPIILKASNRYGVDPHLISAVIHVESEYDPHAVSSKGASGLMQLMPSTALELGVSDIFDPEHNILGGVKYLKQLLSLFDGDPELALAAYNAGMGRVLKYDGIPPYESTREYVRRVLALAHDYRSSGGQVRKSAI